MTSPEQRSIAAFAAELARMQRQIDALETGSNAPRLHASSVQDGSLPIYNGQGEMVAVVGKQDDGTYVGGQAVGWQAPPEVPAAPEVTPGFNLLKIASRGSVDPPWPANMSHIRVWMADGVSTGDDYAGGRIVGTIVGTADSLLIVTDLDANPRRVWLTAVNTSGAESAPSVVVTETPTMVVEQDILDGAISELKLADDAVTEAKLAADSIRTYHFGEKVVDLHALGEDSVGSAQIVAEAILAAHIGAGQVVTAALAAEAVQAGNIAAAAIQAGHLAAASVTSENLVSLSVTSDKLAANSVTAGKIEAGSITADRIKADEVLANISILVGAAGGPRILIDGPNDEIRFKPGGSDSKYGRLFCYTPPDYPDDVTIELRSINSSQTNVLPRFWMAPDKLFAGLVDAADNSVRRGARLQLEEDLAAVGVSTLAGAEYGLSVYGDGLINLKGYFNGMAIPHPNDAIFCLSLQVNNVGSNQMTFIGVIYGATMASPMAPLLSCGVVGSGVSTQMWTVRDESNSTSSFAIRIGMNTPGSSDSVGRAPSVPPGGAIKVRAWVVRVQSEPAIGYTP